MSNFIRLKLSQLPLKDNFCVVPVRIDVEVLDRDDQIAAIEDDIKFWQEQPTREDHPDDKSLLWSRNYIERKIEKLRLGIEWFRQSIPGDRVGDTINVTTVAGNRQEPYTLATPAPFSDNRFFSEPGSTYAWTIKYLPIGRGLLVHHFPGIGAERRLLDTPYGGWFEWRQMVVFRSPVQERRSLWAGCCFSAFRPGSSCSSAGSAPSSSSPATT